MLTKEEIGFLYQEAAISGNRIWAGANAKQS